MKESLYYLIGVCVGLVIGAGQGFVWGFAVRPMWDEWSSGLFKRLRKQASRASAATQMEQFKRIALDMEREAALWPPNERAQQTARLLKSYAAYIRAALSSPSTAPKE